jgi:hypothetical protein
MVIVIYHHFEIHAFFYRGIQQYLLFLLDIVRTFQVQILKRF